MSNSNPIDTLRVLETPEGVDLSLHLAGPVPRAAAFVLDLLVRTAVYLALAPLLALAGVGTGLLLLALFLLEWFYPVFFELARGATPGKRALGLLVVHDDGTPVSVTCPQGCTATVFPGCAENRFLARFEDERCASCPFFKTKCRAQERKRLSSTLYVTRRQVEIALRRLQMSPEDASIRAVVESTIRSLKRAFPGSKLPVRGLILARMMVYPAAMMVNLRRLHGHLTEEAENAAEEGAFSFSLLKTTISRCLKSMHRRFSSLTPQSTAISA